MKKLRYLSEAAALWLFFLIFRILPVDSASAFGGWIGRTIGPRLAASRKIDKNLNHALPGRSPAEYASISRDVWDNLGRVMAEYPHLTELLNKAEIVGEENLVNLPTSFVGIGGHLANWEMLGFYFNYRARLPVTLVYREPNNPYTAWLLNRCRNPDDQGDYVPKSTGGTRALVTKMREGGSSMILIDQKYNEGVRADFFGQPAMTSTAFIQLARKYNCPIVPLWSERIEGANVRMIIDTPIYIEGRSDEEILSLVHGLLEQRILKNPGQWLWLHRRWIT